MKRNSTRLKIFLYLSLPIIFLLVFLLLLGHLAWAKKYETRIYPGITIGEVSLGGLTKAEAKTKIEGLADKIEKEGIPFELNGKIVNVPSAVIADSVEFTQEAYKINLDLTLEKAFNAGRDNDWLAGFSRWILGEYHTYNVKAAYTIDKDILTKVLRSDFSDQETASQNATLKINSAGELEIESEKNGQTISYDLAVKEAENALENFSEAQIPLKTTILKPDTNASDLNNLATEAKKISELAPIKIKAGDYFSTISKSVLISWVKSGTNSTLDFDKDKIKDFISKNLSIRANQEVESPRFEIKGGKMSFWQAGREGRKINLDKSTDQIISNILQDRKNEIALELEIVPFVSIENGDIVINELLGTGHSNFVGSPTNRRKNIAVGAKSVHGLLIKPGEEFSLVKALGDISEQSGYFPELVIKGNKTVPEFGGGLCQVATTLFRSALSAGLPITARQNHSYRVSYYEPAGTDAAVYDPQPDIRFLNDTGNYILIQSRISGNDIYFDFWGVKDGRKAVSSKPTIFNIIKPAPAKTIISSDLNPGQKKCTESAHSGADAFFDYSVTYPNGTVKNVRFKSHYVPWQAVCLVGATSTPISTSTPIIASSTATSTPQN